jgi:hypothetical protein
VRYDHVVASVLLSASAASLQAGEQPGIELTDLSARVRLVVEIHATDSSVFVPVCGADDFGVPLLCSASTRPEVRAGEGWRPAEPRPTCGILTAGPPARLGGCLIAPGTRHRFYFEFSVADFEISVGDSLRIVVDTWSDEESMKAGARAAALAIPPFQCPLSKTAPPCSGK